MLNEYHFAIYSGNAFAFGSIVLNQQVFKNYRFSLFHRANVTILSLIWESAGNYSKYLRNVFTVFPGINAQLVFQCRGICLFVVFRKQTFC